MISLFFNKHLNIIHDIIIGFICLIMSKPNTNVFNAIMYRVFITNLYILKYFLVSKNFINILFHLFFFLDT